MLSEVRPVQPRSCLVEMENILFLSSDMHQQENPQVMVYVVIDEPNSAVQQTVVMQHSLHHRS